MGEFRKRYYYNCTFIENRAISRILRVVGDNDDISGVCKTFLIEATADKRKLKGMVGDGGIYQTMRHLICFSTVNNSKTTGVICEPLQMKLYHDSL